MEREYIPLMVEIFWAKTKHYKATNSTIMDKM